MTRHLGVGGPARVGAAAVAAVLLAGCNDWAQVGHSASHRRHNTVEEDLTVANVASLEETWSVDMPGAGTEPIVADGRVYVGSSGGSTGVRVTALGESDGSVIWERELGEPRPPGEGGSADVLPFARSGDLLSVGFLDFHYPDTCTTGYGLLDPDDGTGALVEDGNAVSPAVTAGSVAVQTSTATSDEPYSCQARSDLNVRATDAESGAELWTGVLPMPEGEIDYDVGFDPPTIADDRVFVAHGGTLAAFDLGGCGNPVCSPIWSVDLSWPSGLDVGTPVAGSGGQVYVAAGGNRVVSVAADTGAELWRAQARVLAPMALANDVLYVREEGPGNDPDHLRAYAANGCGEAVCEPLWSAPVTPIYLGGPNSGAPVVAGGVVYIGGEGSVGEGSVKAFDASGCGATTCSPIASLPVDGGAAHLAVAKGKLFVTTAHEVTAFAPAAEG